MMVRKIKEKIRHLLCLNIVHQDAPKIIKIDATDIGYGGMLKQRMDNKQNLVRFTSSTWNDTQRNYFTIKKKILAIFKVITNFQGDLLNQ